MKILYIPNERPGKPQTGFRRSFTNLRTSGLIQDLSVFSLQLRILNGGEPEVEISNLIKRVRDFQPNIIFIQKAELTGLRKRHIRRMRQAADFKLIYHEGDPYTGPLHPLPLASRAVGNQSDVVFTVGDGVFARNFRNAGARDVRYVPHCFELDLVGEYKQVDETEKIHDVVVVANRHTPRFRGLPNWRERIRFVQQLQHRFGDRLGLYGNYWDGIGAKGPTPFAQQSETIKSGWISANWDHFAGESKYFSDRLPISLAAGSVHATTWHPGYDELFPPETTEFLILAKSPEALVDAISEKLENTKKIDLLNSGIQARNFAEANFRQDRKMVEMLNYERVVIDPDKAEACWDVGLEITAEI